MHIYLRSVGFSEYRKKRDIEKLLNELEQTALSRRRIQIDTDYNGIGKILYFMGQQGLSQESSEYTDKVSITVLVPGEQAEHFCKEVIELTAGRSTVTVLEEVFYPVPEK